MATCACDVAEAGPHAATCPLPWLAAADYPARAPLPPHDYRHGPCFYCWLRWRGVHVSPKVDDL